MRKSWVWKSGVALALAMTVSVRADDRTARAPKAPGVSIRAATTTPAAGYDKAAFEGQTLYIAPQALLTADQVTGATAQASNGATAMSLSLTEQAMGRLSGSPLASHAAIFLDGQLVAVGSMSLSNGQLTVSGLPSGQAERVARLLSKGASSPAITVVAAGQSNGQYVFDAYAQNVSGLRTYQVKLVPSGGDRGSLSLSDVRIDEARSDYVFAGNEAIKAADQSGSRVGGTLFSGTVDVTSPVYLGTWVFQASPDAAGTFQIRVISTNSESFLADTHNNLFSTAMTGATVQIGGSVPSKLTR